MKSKTNQIVERENLIQELIELVFKKVKKDSGEITAYGISRYLNEKINDKINDRTLTRYYDGYFLNKESEKRTPDEFTLKVFCEYLGFKNFNDFEVRREYEKTKNDLENKIMKMKKIGLSSIMVLLIIASLFISKYYKKNCMIWVDDHYEKIRCSGLDMEDALDIVRLQKFKKVEVCKDSVFFKNGKPVKHYLRHNNEIDFFTYSGKHPIYEDKSVNEVTSRIIENYVKPCDSILKD